MQVGHFLSLRFVLVHAEEPPSRPFPHGVRPRRTSRLTCPSWRRAEGLRGCGTGRDGTGGSARRSGSTRHGTAQRGAPRRGREPQPPVTQGSPPRAPRILFL